MHPDRRRTAQLLPASGSDGKRRSRGEVRDIVASSFSTHGERFKTGHRGRQPDHAIVAFGKRTHERREALADLKRKVGCRGSDELGKLVVARKVVDMLGDRHDLTLPATVVTEPVEASCWIPAPPSARMDS